MAAGGEQEARPSDGAEQWHTALDKTRPAASRRGYDGILLSAGKRGPGVAFGRGTTGQRIAGGGTRKSHVQEHGRSFALQWASKIQFTRQGVQNGGRSGGRVQDTALTWRVILHARRTCGTKRGREWGARTDAPSAGQQAGTTTSRAKPSGSACTVRGYRDARACAQIHFVWPLTGAHGRACCSAGSWAGIFARVRAQVGRLHAGPLAL
mmetsp:Transcript_10141/g.23797  ORF Transcript_10141/g.23797 Transcript_10141/m.23797 type:complete len:209 (-) Transcript_10141:61-687(-)